MVLSVTWMRCTRTCPCPILRVVKILFIPRVLCCECCDTFSPLVIRLCMVVCFTAFRLGTLIAAPENIIFHFLLVYLLLFKINSIFVGWYWFFFVSLYKFQFNGIEHVFSFSLVRQKKKKMFSRYSWLEKEYIGILLFIELCFFDIFQR